MTRILVFGMNENPGGMESFLMNYYRRIDRDEIQFDFLTNCPVIAYEDEIEALGGRVFKIAARSQNYRLYRRQLTAFFELHAADYDGVWLNTCSLANIDYLKMAMKYGIPRRIIHSHNAQNMDSRLRGVLHALNKGAVTRYATDFWACSREAGAFFYDETILSGPRYREIPNAIDPTPFLFDPTTRAQVRAAMGVEDALVIGNVGRLHFQKNQAFLLDIFKEIRTARPHSRLWLVGQGEDEPLLRRKAEELGLTAAVDFLGVRDDIPRLLQGMDVFLFPSRFEGLGIALVEAQAAGLPCLASTAVPRDAAVTDLVTFLPLSDTPAAWAQTALRVADTPRTDRGADIVAAGYDIASQTARLEGLLTERRPYLLTELPQNIFNAGFKAKNDIRTALNGQVTDLVVEECFRFDKIPAFRRLLRQLHRLPVGAELMMQCPIYSFFNGKFLPLLCRVIQKRQLRLTLILHDVDSLRYYDGALNKLERRLYGLAHRVIVHNEEMKKVLWDTHDIPMKKMTVLGIFDYLLDEAPAGADEAYTKTVLVAGNLDPQKSGYLYRLGELAQTVPVNLYGGNFAADQAADSLHYMGSFPPDQLPAHLRGNFGLVWDGDSADTCSGQTGEYLRINNPHKTSLYLAAGFPVIIWKRAALAPFITENGLGLAVDSLAELPSVLEELSPADYTAIRQRVRDFGARLREGEYIRRALSL